MAEKKKFYQVEVPLLNMKTELIGTSIEDLDNRNIKLDLTRILKGKSVEIKLRVEVKAGKAVAHPLKLSLMGFYVRRMVRKGTDYVEDSFVTKCKNSDLIIKPFLITRKRVHRSVRKALRDKARQEILEYVKDKKYEEIFSDLLSGKFQKHLNPKLKKVYPLAMCDIRILEIKKQKKHQEEKPETKEVEKPKAEAKKEPEKVIKEKPTQVEKKQPEKPETKDKKSK